MNSRLVKLLTDRGGEIENGDFLDDYDQCIFKDISVTITTRIISCCHYFIYETEDNATESNAGRNSEDD